MSYTLLEKQIRALPEKYLEDVSNYIEYLLYREQRARTESESQSSHYFGSLTSLPDGLTAQRSMRNEWS